MKKIGDLMKEIGFNPQASDSVKEAFIKHLIKQSTGAHVQTPSEKKIVAENPEKFISFKFKQDEKYSLPTQLSFSFDKTEVIKNKKTAI